MHERFSLAGVSSNPSTLVKKLANTPLERAQLYKELVTLRSDIDMGLLRPSLLPSPEEEGTQIQADTATARGEGRASASARTGAMAGAIAAPEAIDPGAATFLAQHAPEAPSDSKAVDVANALSTSVFRYTGETDDAEEYLADLGRPFVDALTALRRQYHKIDRVV
jgi:hypothetical protein